jgi:hypothetical protein
MTDFPALAAKLRKPLQYRTIEGVDVPYHPDGEPLDDLLIEAGEAIQALLSSLIIEAILAALANPTHEMIEAARTAPKHAFDGSSLRGPWRIYLKATGAFVEMFEGAMSQAMARCGYLDAQAAIAAAFSRLPKK